MKEIHNYVKQAREQGMHDNEIHSDLKEAGWDKDTISSALSSDHETKDTHTKPKGNHDSPLLSQLPGQLPGVVDLLKDAWQQYKRQFKTLIFLTILPILIVIAFSLLLLPVGMASGFIIAIAGESQWAQVLSIAVAVIIGLALLIGMIVAIMASQYGIVYHVTGKSRDWRRAMQFGFAGILGLLWVQLVSQFALVIPFMLFFIPAIYFGVLINFAQFVYVKEDQKGLMALAHSSLLVKGHWWAVAGRGIALFFIIYIPLMILSIIGASISETVEIASSGLVQLLSFLITPFVVIYSYKIFSALRELKPSFPEEQLAKERNMYKWLSLIGAAIGITLVGLATAFGIYLLVEGSRSGFDFSSLLEQGEYNYQLDEASMQEYENMFPENMEEFNLDLDKSAL